jgi:outer membrane lipoprotein SlyB
MNHRFIAIVAGLALATAAQAQTAPPSPQAQYAADKKAAATRYQSDRNLCNDETTSKARLDCRREAKAQYDSALALAKAKLAESGPGPAIAAAPAVCADCGKVADVSTKEEAGKGGPVGMIAGGVGGALLGHQIGGGTGKDVATIAGAVGGAYAGKKIEEKVTARKVWTVTVDYPNNLKKSYQFDKDPGFRIGDPVKSSGSSIVRR